MPPLAAHLKEARAQQAHAVGSCQGCGYGIALTGATSTRCPGCGKRVRLRWVSGLMTGQACDDRCMYARGTDCECGCGGGNHALGYLLGTSVPQWVRDRDEKAHADKATRAAERAEARREAERRAREERRAALLAEHPALAALFDEPYASRVIGFMPAMRQALESGDMSPRMIARTLDVIEEDQERARARRAELAAEIDATAAGVTLPVGRVEVSGVIADAEERDDIGNPRGGKYWQITIAHPDGWRVIGRMPKDLEPSWDAPPAEWRGWQRQRVGDGVTITATVEPHKTRSLVGYFKRPILRAHTRAAAPVVDQVPEVPAPVVDQVPEVPAPVVDQLPACETCGGRIVGPRGGWTHVPTPEHSHRVQPNAAARAAEVPAPAEAAPVAEAAHGGPVLDLGALSPMARGRLEKHLARLVRYGGDVMTHRDMYARAVRKYVCEVRKGQGWQATTAPEYRFVMREEPHTFIDVPKSVYEAARFAHLDSEPDDGTPYASEADLNHLFGPAEVPAPVVDQLPAAPVVVAVPGLAPAAAPADPWADLFDGWADLFDAPAPVAEVPADPWAFLAA